MVPNPEIDILDNPAITVSNTYSIIPGGIIIVSQNSAEMLAAFAGYTAINKSVSYTPILLPIGVGKEKITKLNDVYALGGKILTPQLYK